MNWTDDIAVKREPHDDPQVSKVFAVLKDRIEHRCSARVIEAEANPRVILSTAGHLPPEAFSIDPIGAAVRIAGGSARGLLYGAGKFLRTSRFEGEFLPSLWRGTSVPQGSLRGMYFANHFHNWYYMAGDEEVVRYTEDMALWGVNAIMTSYPMINLQGWDDPEAEDAMTQTRKLFRAAKSIGLAKVMAVGNVLFNSTPSELRAIPLRDPLGLHGNSGVPVCPSISAGRELILKTTVDLIEKLADIGLDYLCIWPYDEGGCACERCRPWGVNGFVRMSREIAEAGRKILPDLKIILSTWTFDTPPEGEWQGLADALARDGAWADYILADSHEDFPRYPLEAGVPGNLPLINFPEISMWGNWPWGGYGAHPLPARLQRLWDQAKHALKGGLAYSEGIYEDINKAVVSQFYWNRDRSAQETLREYIAYEFSPTVVQDISSVIDLLEISTTQSHLKQAVDADKVRTACHLVCSADLRLPEWARQSWRWEIVRLRAMLDQTRFADGGLGNLAAETSLGRLAEIYHCQVETDDPYHHRVRPLLRQAVSRYGEC